MVGRLGMWALLLLGTVAATIADEGARLDRYGDPLPRGAVMRLGTVRLRHVQSIIDLTYSPDGKKLATAGAMETVLWDAESGKALHYFKGAWKVAFRPDGRVLRLGDRGVARRANG